MSLNYIDNDRQPMSITDMNFFGDANRGYWWDTEGRLFNGMDLYSKCLAKSTNPIPASYCSSAQTDPVLKLRFDNEWYWLIGDVLHGGIGFCYDHTDYFAMYYFTVDLENHTASAWYNGQAFYKGMKFYLLHNVYFAGNMTYAQQGIIKSNDNGLFTIGFNEPIFAPNIGITGMTQVEVTTQPALHVGNSIPPMPATTVKVNAKTTNGIHFTLADLTIIDIPEQGWCKPTLFANAPAWWENLENENYIPDPSSPGGYNSTGGGYGVPQASVNIDFPNLPPDLLINSGIIKMYTPSSTDMKNLMNFIYSSPTAVLDNIKKIWSNPMDSIISFGIIPWYIDPTNLPTEEVKFCGVNSGVYMHKLNSQYATVDCGRLDINEEYNSILDYENYTRVKIYLPFIGCSDLSIDDVMGASLFLKYFIDLFTGECVAILKCVKYDATLDYTYPIEFASCLYEFKGNVLSSAPITGNNWQQLYSGVLNLVSQVAIPSPIGLKAGKAIQKAGMKAIQKAGDVSSDAVSEIFSEKVQVQRTGNITGNAGTLGEYVPYIILEKPIRSVPMDNESLNGYPLNWGGTLNDFVNTKNEITGNYGSGYTVIKPNTARINDIDALDEEKQMIKEILESGVVL